MSNRCTYDFERLCADTRRSLQRDQKAMLGQGLRITEGETHHLDKNESIEK